MTNTPNEELNRLAQRTFALNKTRERLSADFAAYIKEDSELLKGCFEFMGKLIGMLQEKEKRIRELETLPRGGYSGPGVPLKG